MINNQPNDDLKAFERRIIEILACYHPQTKRWRIVLLVLALSTLIAAIQWLDNQHNQQYLNSIEYLRNNPFIAFNLFIITISLVFGIHKKVVSPNIIANRIRSVLENFNMSCDENGCLILRRTSNSNASNFSNSHCSVAN